jgi:hypothetical protein
VGAQRLDEAGQRRERGPQLVAGVGQEVRAHALCAPRVGLVTQQDHQFLHRAGFPFQGLGEGAPEPRLHADGLERHHLGLAGRQGLVDRLQHLGPPQGRAERGADEVDPVELARGGVGVGDLRPLILLGAHKQHRLRKELEDGGGRRG